MSYQHHWEKSIQTDPRSQAANLVLDLKQHECAHRQDANRMPCARTEADLRLQFPVPKGTHLSKVETMTLLPVEFGPSISIGGLRVPSYCRQPGAEEWVYGLAPFRPSVEPNCMQSPSAQTGFAEHALLTPQSWRSCVWMVASLFPIIPMLPLYPPVSPYSSPFYFPSWSHHSSRTTS